jgi:hypothetical protein
VAQFISIWFKVAPNLFSTKGIMLRIKEENHYAVQSTKELPLNLEL